MRWETILDRPQLNVRIDTSDDSLLLEINDGGMSAQYVACRLGGEEVRALIDALLQFEERTAGRKP